MVKYNNVFFVHCIQALGGVETYLWEIAKKYHEYDVVVAYQEADGKQLDRLRKLVRCIRVIPGKPIKCKKCFHAYEFDYNLVQADEYYQCIHANYEIQNLPPNISKNITGYLGVSKWVSEAYERLLKDRGVDRKVEVCYNPISVEEPRKVLKLISPTRLSPEKGKDRMIKLAEELIRQNIPFIWLVFTDAEIPKLPGFIRMDTQIDVRDYIAEADYLVQLSDTEGYCYAVMEAWCLGTMTITTPVVSFYEQGLVDGENGYIIDFNMSDLDKFVQKIYNGVHDFKYTPKPDGYEDKIIKEPSTYSLDDFIKVKSVRNFWDSIRELWVMENTIITIEKTDIDYYRNMGCIEC